MGASAGRLARRGRMFSGLSAHETWQKVLGAKCPCGRALDCGARVFYPTQELVKDKPDVAMRLAAKNGGKIPVIQFRGAAGQPVEYTGIANLVACRACRKELETTLAREVPSYACVEWYEGPGEHKPQVSVL